MKVRNLIASVFALFAFAFAPLAKATLQGGGSTYVQSVRIESGYAYITLDAPFTNCPRVYLDMSVTINKSILATAELAWALAKVVQIRAYDTGPTVNGACPLFDIQAQN